MKVYIVIWESKKRGEHRRVSATPFFGHDKAKKWLRGQVDLHYPPAKSIADLSKDLEYYSLYIAEEKVR